MKKKKQFSPAQCKLSVLHQICNLIPGHLVPSLARELGVQKRARDFSPWSHVVSMLYAHLSHAFGLNDLCDALEMNRGPLSAIRAATYPSRNGLSHANKNRSAALPEKLFWKLADHLENQHPGFGRDRRSKRLAWRFHKSIHVVDATTLPLVANCMDWAKHRRRKAAAKCHLRLDLESFLPRFALVDTAAHHESTRAREVCAGLKAGEIALFDKGFLDLAHLQDLTRRGVSWVTRAKENIAVKRIRKLKPANPRILRDEIVRFKYHNSLRDYPQTFRRVVALVEVDGEDRTMTFITNHFEWSGQTVADLYRCRWSIEVFFKYLKQTLQLTDFLGYSANAVRWQVWTALIVYLLLRFMAWTSKWSGHFSRLFTILRAALWRRWDLADLAQHYGTAGLKMRFRIQAEQSYFVGFS